MEQDALVQIIQMNYKLLIVQAYRILRHSQDAEDAVQNACLKAWRRSSMLRNSDCAVTWLRQIVCFECIDLLRSRKRQSAFVHQMDRLPDENSKQTDSLFMIALNDAFLSGSSQHRELLYNKYVMGYTISQLSLMMGVSEGTVKSRLSRAKRHLIDAMSKLWS